MYCKTHYNSRLQFKVQSIFLPVIAGVTLVADQNLGVCLHVSRKNERHLDQVCIFIVAILPFFIFDTDILRRVCRQATVLLIILKNVSIT